MEEVKAVADVLQIIDDEYQFRPSVKEEMGEWGTFYESGYDYNIVSILGPQSGGKSTLLNLLFDTKFPEMDPQARQQTTKGLWLAHDTTKKCLVMDVEGTDSKERGEQHINFERKSALFSLALSEVLIVNMWSHDVGRYTASNYDTLKTCFDIHMSLFHTAESPKTLLLFCLRDKQMTPLENLKETLISDMKNIWAEITKPEYAKDSVIEDYFEFQFLAMSNFVYQKEEFMNDVRALRARFENSSAQDYIFETKFSKRIPADGFPEYSSRIWKQILANKNVDIPSMKEMLATVRCEELLTVSLAKLKEGMVKIRTVLEEEKVVEEFSLKINTAVTETMELFDKQASLYFEPVYKSRRTALEEQIEEILDNLRSMQLKNIMTSEIKKLDEGFTEPVHDILKQAAPNMWEAISILFCENVDTAIPRIETSSKEMGSPPSIVEQSVKNFKEKAVSLVEKQMKENVQRLPTTMTKRFEKSFKTNEDGVPRAWDENDDLPELFKVAKEKTLKLLDLFSVLKISHAGEEIKVTILTEAQKSKVENETTIEMGRVYDECLQIKKQRASGNVPPWMYVVMVILGFNEIVWLIETLLKPTNLFLLILFGIIMGGTYLLHQMNLLGPAEEIVKVMLKELVVQCQKIVVSLGDKIKEASENAAVSNREKTKTD